jgi:hypothetical protein
VSAAMGTARYMSVSRAPASGPRRRARQMGKQTIVTIM